MAKRKVDVGQKGMNDDYDMLPAMPKYYKNDLRPNPVTADPMEETPFGQETILVGHFSKPNDGTAKSWGASARVTNGLAKPGGKNNTAQALGADSEFTKPPKNIRRPLY